MRVRFSSLILGLCLLMFSAEALAAGGLRGVVKDDAGKPLPGALVVASPGGHRSTTDAGGHYVFTGLKPGTYSLRATKAGYAPASLRVKVPAEELLVTPPVMVLRRKSALAGKDTAAEGAEDELDSAMARVTGVGAAKGGGRAGAAAPASTRSDPKRTPSRHHHREKKPRPRPKRPSVEKARDSFEGGYEPPAPVRVAVAAEGEVERGPSPAPPATPAPGVAPPPPARVSSRRPTGRRPPRAPGVKAGYSDDNRQFNSFLDYLERFAHLQSLKLDVSNRVRFQLRDQAGRPIPNCRLDFVHSSGKVLQRRSSYADGRVHFYPSEDSAFQGQGMKVRASCLGQTQERSLDVHGRREIELRYSRPRPVYQRIPLDIAFVLDTTGSMGDEIERLKSTLEAIHFQISHLGSKPDVRFGMVLFRDKGDEYRTQVVPFTRELKTFQARLAKVAAGGGGDTPEDLQEGMRRTLQDLHWRKDGLRLAFVLADAPPHLDYGQDFTYLTAMRKAAEQGIKLVTIGASGLPPQGEMVFRQMAQYTQGLFVFLTYGEKGESSGGTSASVSHHTGSNWQSKDLDAIVVQMVKQELSHLGAKATEQDDEYYDLPDVPKSDKDALITELFEKGVGQLLKYSTLRIPARTPTTIIPPNFKARGPKDKRRMKALAEWVEERLVLAMTKEPSFQLVERRDAQKLLDEMARTGSDLFDPDRSATVGKLVGAKLATISRLKVKKDRLEVFVKLVRVDTGEVLSVALLKVAPELVE